MVVLFELLIVLFYFFDEEDDGGDVGDMPVVVEEVFDEVLEFDVVIEIVDHVAAVSFIVISE